MFLWFKNVAYLVLIYLSRHFDQVTVSDLFVFQLPPVTTSLTTQRYKAIPLSALPKDTSEAGFSSHYSFNAERQAGML